MTRTHHRRQGDRRRTARAGRRRGAAPARRARLEPGLAVVLVGENPASAVYVRNKSKQTVEAGMRSFDHRLPETVSREPNCWRWSRSSTPIRPCTASWCSCRCRRRSTARRCSPRSIPAKDVDGFHPMNAGRLATGLPALTPCTPLGCVMLAKTVHRLARRHGGRGGRPLQHRRQAAGPAAARRERDRDGRAFEDARPARRVAAAPTSCSRRSAGPRWCAATGSSRARP